MHFLLPRAKILTVMRVLVIGQRNFEWASAIYILSSLEINIISRNNEFKFMILKGINDIIRLFTENPFQYE